MSDNRLKIGITQGDINGVGWEVILVQKRKHTRALSLTHTYTRRVGTENKTQGNVMKKQLSPNRSLIREY